MMILYENISTQKYRSIWFPDTVSIFSIRVLIFFFFNQQTVFSFLRSAPERITAGGSQQEAEPDPGGGPGLWQLHEQRPERERIRLQDLQSQQDR